MARGSTATVKQLGRDVLEVHIPVPRHQYVNNVMRASCFEELWWLYKAATEPLKELSESYAAHRWLAGWRKRPMTVIHVGDGARALTAAMFAFMTPHLNLAIDPLINEQQVSSWRDRFDVQRFDYFKGRVEDYPLEQLPGPLLFTFVHAHVDVDRILARVPGRWLAAYTLACCSPASQLGHDHHTLEEGEDWNVLSSQRQFRLIVPEREDS
jgi:hypothetical protein